MNLPRELPPGPALMRRVVPRWDRPETEFPALVPVGTLRFDRAEPSAVAVTGVLAYSNGFEFFVTRLLRPDGPGFEGGSWPASPEVRRVGPPARHTFEIGLEFAGGSRVFGNVPPSNGAPAGPILRFTGGIGTAHRSDSRYWTWPLPPAGRLDFICRLGTVETRVSMDAQLIIDASRRSVPAWPGN